MGIRRWYESRQRPGEPVSLDEYFGDIFEHSVPGLPEAAEAAGMTPLEYMRRHGAFPVPHAGQERHEWLAGPEEPGVDLTDGTRRAGFPTPSRRFELHSPTLAEWGFGDQAIPDHRESHAHWSKVDLAAGQRVLLPTFRLPTLIHTRSSNAKWLQELSHSNPLWVHPEDAEALGLEQAGLVRVTTRIGHFVVRAWVTEGIHPGIVACSHHVGRWRLHREVGGHKLSSALVEIVRGDGTFLFRQVEPVGPFSSSDPDTQRIWWREAGVNQNLTFPVQPDPASGMHCWHQVVTVAPAQAGDRHADVFVDTRKSVEVYREWLALTKPAPGPGGLRRPLWLNRPLRPTEAAYLME
jgi:anaerobic selenocysteine-containing dehydrogenase